MDPRLDPFLAARPEDAETVLGDLLARHAGPIVRRVAAGRLGGGSPELDDIEAQVLFDLMLRLRRARGDDQLAAIASLDGYVAAAARHACDHALRRKYPLRWRLRNRIRYVLEHDARWRTWRSDAGVWMCGGAGSETEPHGTPPRVADLPATGRDRVRELLETVFRTSGGPLELGAVVTIAAEAWQVPLMPADDHRDVDAVDGGSRPADMRIIDRARAAQAWTEIGQLPLRQRQALLLNLKDDALNLFVVTGTASLRAIAGAVDMTAEALAALWPALPLADATLAERLGCTRQQIINLRMAARKRLGNRLAGWS